MVSKGELTRQSILDHAMTQASRLGLEGLSIGGLARELELSKSGLFAHFRSKEALQLQVLQYAEERFVEHVIRPALAAPRGEARVRALFEHWRHYPDIVGLGGCVFVAVSTELDDREGPARDHLVNQQKDWLDTIATVVRTAITEGHFHEDLDPAQFAYELYGLMFMFHHATRLLRDERAHERTQRAFEALVERSKP